MSAAFHLHMATMHVELQISDPHNIITIMTSNAAFAFGDPHFQTLDRRNYTFNGIGEYSLVSTPESVGFDVQARLEAFSSNVTGSVISNVVVKLGDIPTVQVEAGREQLHMYIGGVLHELAVGDSPLVLNASGVISNNLMLGIIGNPMELALVDEQMIVRMDDTNSLVISFGRGGAVIVSLQTSFLAVSMALPDSFNNMTRGLLGVFNNNSADDFRDKNGSILSLSSEQEIYQFGLMCKCSC